MASSLITSLVSYWKLDGTSADSVGSNNGTDTQITYSAANGYIRKGAGFAKANSSKIACGTGTGLRITGALSISCWMKRSGAQVLETAVVEKQSDSGTAAESYYLGFNAATTKMSFFIYNGTTYYEIDSSTVIPDGVWTHIVAVYDGVHYLYIYINGVQDAKSTDIGAITIYYNGNYQFYIGTDKAYSTRFYNGALDEIGVWSKGLTAAEVSQLYNHGSGNSYPFSQGGASLFF